MDFVESVPPSSFLAPLLCLAVDAFVRSLDRGEPTLVESEQAASKPKLYPRQWLPDAALSSLDDYPVAMVLRNGLNQSASRFSS